MDRDATLGMVDYDELANFSIYLSAATLTVLSLIGFIPNDYGIPILSTAVYTGMAINVAHNPFSVKHHRPIIPSQMMVVGMTNFLAHVVALRRDTTRTTQAIGSLIAAVIAYVIMLYALGDTHTPAHFKNLVWVLVGGSFLVDLIAFDSLLASFSYPSLFLQLLVTTATLTFIDPSLPLPLSVIVLASVTNALALVLCSIAYAGSVHTSLDAVPWALSTSCVVITVTRVVPWPRIKFKR